MALATIRKKGNNKVILLQCVSSYPAPLNEQNLKSLPEIEKRFKTLVGLSDHTKGHIAPVAAVSFGARIIEKHFNLSNNKSVDSFFSTNEREFHLMTKNIRLTEETFGSGIIKISKSSSINLNSKRSIYVSKDIKKMKKLPRKILKS